ncbi:MAG: PaaI family thioesterase [Caulobacteraceae bacterium]
MRDSDPDPPPPEGFAPSAGRGGFSTHNGPYYDRSGHGVLEQAFFARSRHCNSLGLIHGGMLSSFLDGLMAGAAARATGTTPVTLHLSLDFIGMGRAGEWVVGEARATRATRDITFVEGRAHVLGRDLARGGGLFKMLRRRP